MYPEEKVQKAATAFIKAQRAFEFTRDNPPPTRSKGSNRPINPPSVRAFARRHGVSHTPVYRAIKHIMNNTTPSPAGRPSLLSSAEDEALVAYVQYLEQSGVPATREQVCSLANSLLQRKHGDDASEVSIGWYRKWRDDHGELRQAGTKSVEEARKAFENADPTYLVDFYHKLEEVIKEHDIGASEFWNEDECGIRIGTLYKRFHVIITRVSRRSRPKLSDPANRETCTLLGCGNAVGDDIPPWLIFKVFPRANWALIDLEEEARFAQSDTGFSNAVISLEWLRTFNLHSWKKSAKAQRCGKSLLEWFGVDEHFRDELGRIVQPDTMPLRSKKEKIFRALIIDGFTGHTTLEFVDYCITFDIVVIVLPPHSTHLLQPMDLSIFQPLKNAHQDQIRMKLMSGEIRFSRTDFLESFKKIYQIGFAKHHIISGFEKSGLFPPNPTPVLGLLARERSRLHDIVSKGYATLLPTDDRFQAAISTADHIDIKYAHLFSPTTSRVWRERIRPALNEGQMLHSQVHNFVRDKRKRTESHASRRRIGALCRPQGVFVTSVNHKEIQERFEEELEKQRKETDRRQRRMMISYIKEDINKIWVDYRASKKQLIDGKLRTLTKKQWLQHTGRDVELYTLEESLDDHKRALSGKPDPFFFDLTGSSSSNRNEESIRRAQRHQNILKNLSDGAFPNSDDIEITVNDSQDPSNYASEPEDNDDQESHFLPQETAPFGSQASLRSLPSSSPALPSSPTRRLATAAVDDTLTSQINRLYEEAEQMNQMPVDLTLDGHSDSEITSISVQLT
jgi:DDE superfamily endonuclease/Tc5 transposase-like DNA-binding protein